MNTQDTGFEKKNENKPPLTEENSNNCFMLNHPNKIETKEGDILLMGIAIEVDGRAIPCYVPEKYIALLPNRIFHKPEHKVKPPTINFLSKTIILKDAVFG
jgi:hypothetical protein